MSSVATIPRRQPRERADGPCSVAVLPCHRSLGSVAVFGVRRAGVTIRVTRNDDGGEAVPNHSELVRGQDVRITGMAANVWSSRRRLPARVRTIIQQGVVAVSPKARAATVGRGQCSLPAGGDPGREAAGALRLLRVGRIPYRMEFQTPCYRGPRPAPLVEVRNSFRPARSAASRSAKARVTTRPVRGSPGVKRRCKRMPGDSQQRALGREPKPTAKGPRVTWAHVRPRPAAVAVQRWAACSSMVMEFPPNSAAASCSRSPELRCRTRLR